MSSSPVKTSISRNLITSSTCECLFNRILMSSLVNVWEGPALEWVRWFVHVNCPSWIPVLLVQQVLWWRRLCGEMDQGWSGSGCPAREERRWGVMRGEGRVRRGLSFTALGRDTLSPSHWRQRIQAPESWVFPTSRRTSSERGLSLLLFQSNTLKRKQKTKNKAWRITQTPASREKYLSHGNLRQVLLETICLNLSARILYWRYSR